MESITDEASPEESSGHSEVRNRYPDRRGEVVPESGYVVENRGTGYPAIVRELARAGMPAPKPEDLIGYFRLTLAARGDGRAEQPVAEATSAASAAARLASSSSLDAEQRRVSRGRRQ